MSAFGMGNAWSPGLPRLKDRILWEERGERKFMMQLVVFTYNYQAAKVGYNEIATVYQQPLLKNTSLCQGFTL